MFNSELLSITKIEFSFKFGFPLSSSKISYSCSGTKSLFKYKLFEFEGGISLINCEEFFSGFFDVDISSFSISISFFLSFLISSFSFLISFISSLLNSSVLISSFFIKLSLSSSIGSFSDSVI